MDAGLSLALKQKKKRRVTEGKAFSNISMNKQIFLSVMHFLAKESEFVGDSRAEIAKRVQLIG
jgi:hypothetical protein